MWPVFDKVKYIGRQNRNIKIKYCPTVPQIGIFFPLNFDTRPKINQ